VWSHTSKDVRWRGDRMTDFISVDTTGSRFEAVSVTNARLRDLAVRESRSS
jgi:hypothetical protein